MAQELISASGKRTIRELNMQGQRVLLRVDFNVPLSDGKIVDDSRIRAAVPTIKALLDGGASVVIMSHLGRPDGRVVDGLRLRPAAERLTQLIRVNVPTTGDALGVGTDDAVRRLRPGELLLLENVRFHAGEERNDPAFAERLASYGDVFVNDAFGAAHRAHASTVGVAAYLPSYVGLLMEQEVEALSNLLEKPARPFAAIVGGGKVSGKVAVLEALIKKVDLLILGGGVANTFLVASGRSVGKSLYESRMVDDARRILKLAQDRGVRVLLPVDGVVAKEVTRGTEFKVVSTDKLPASWHMVDLGPASITAIREALAPIKTILWNGPLGVFEIPSFAVATRELAKVAAEKADAGATVVVGGGDSIAALRQLGVAEKMTHLSTGGGASLEFLEGRDLPGLAVVPTAGSPYETLPIVYVSPVKPGGKAAAKRAPAKPKPIIKPSALDDEDDESDTLA
jgi:phosphoglycerate kinase